MSQSPREIGIEGHFLNPGTDDQLKSKCVVKALETFPLKEKDACCHHIYSTLHLRF